MFADILYDAAVLALPSAIKQNAPSIIQTDYNVQIGSPF